MLESFKQPAYTGENRCTPCTVLNLTIVLGLAGVLRMYSDVAALAVVLGGVAVIYLRGYLVPGTPTLTRRFFPDRVLSWFGNEHDVPADGVDGTDVERVLADAGVLGPCDAGLDLCLDREFRRVWQRELRTLPEPSSFPMEALVGLELAPTTSIEERRSTVALSIDDQTTGWWPSHAAFRADAAAAICLSERYYGWRDLDFRERTAVLAGLRLWLDACPDCGAPLELGETVVDSCCSSRDVIAMTCTGCGERLLEAPHDT